LEIKGPKLVTSTVQRAFQSSNQM